MAELPVSKKRALNHYVACVFDTSASAWLRMRTYKCLGRCVWQSVQGCIRVGRDWNEGGQLGGCWCNLGWVNEGLSYWILTRSLEVVIAILGVGELLKGIAIEEKDQKTWRRAPSLDWNWGHLIASNFSWPTLSELSIRSSGREGWRDCNSQHLSQVVLGTARRFREGAERGASEFGQLPRLV